MWKELHGSFETAGIASVKMSSYTRKVRQATLREKLRNHSELCRKLEKFKSFCLYVKNNRIFSPHGDRQGVFIAVILWHRWGGNVFENWGKCRSNEKKRNEVFTNIKTCQTLKCFEFE